MYKRILFLITVLISILFLCSCRKQDKKIAEYIFETKNATEELQVLEKGYNLFIADDIKEEAETDCKKIMEQIKEIYLKADKGEASNVVITEETIIQICIALQETEAPVFESGFSYNMVNYDKLEQFLENSLHGEVGKIVTYKVLSNGGIGRMQFIFNGTDMYLLNTIAMWNDKNESYISSTSYTKIKKWEWTQKGWFIFECYVPEPPEVSEVINGNAMIRVKPVDEKYLEIAKKYLYPIGYQGNNLFCSDWSTDQMEDIDYNGLFEYLYTVKNGQKIDSEMVVSGIPKNEFEQLMTDYLPITAEQLQQYALYDNENQIYAWERLGCLNYSPSFFGTSIPEITDMIDNKDGSVTLTVDAVCEMLGSDAVITHELTIQFLKDGNIRYLENEILEDGIEKIPEYQYRFRNK